MSDYDEYEEYDDHDGDGGYAETGHVLSEEEIMAIQEEYRAQKVKEAIIPWIVGTVFTGVMVGAMLYFMVSKPVEEESQVVAVTPPAEEIVEEDPPPPPEPEVPPEPSETITSDPVTTSVASPDAPDQVGAIDDVSDDAPSTDDNAQTDLVCDVKSMPNAMTSAKVFGGRSASGRRGALSTYGGSLAGQAVLDNALKWLASVQNPDGSWGESSKEKNGLSGLALLVFLAHGETPKSKKYGETVMKSIKYLCTQTEFESSHGGSYCQAAKIYALAEAYTMTGNYEIIDPLTIMIEDMLDCQDGAVSGETGSTEAGGFDYFHKGQKAGGKYDNSLGALAFQAIKAAKATGLEFGKYGHLDYSKKKGVNHLINASKEGYPYAQGKGAKSRSNMGLKGAGAFCLFLFEEGHQPEVKGLIKELEDKAHKQLDWNAPQANKLYAWYYITNAFFQEGGKNWKIWGKNFQRVLQKQQNPAGYWDYPGTFYGKSGKDIEDKVHATVFCGLMLTVFYRYLPSTTKKGGKNPAPKKGEAKVPPAGDEKEAQELDIF